MDALHLFNTQSRKKEAFVPIDPPRVQMYVCGPTVYDSPHVGHARSAVAFDVLRRYLEYKGHDVIFTRNYTDIDDKMIARANERGVTVSELARQYIEEYERAMERLNVKPPVYAPRATHLIDDFITFIKDLIDRGHAYEKNGNVYFDVASCETYGELSSRPDKEIEDTLRRDSEEFATDKRDSRDFALWKARKENEPAWSSPWGEGRPGWHIECSVMSTKLLGETIDIHGGGRDLVFPHHENEKAQSEAHSGKTFCNYWVHNGFVNVDKEKMSKSLGNFFTVADVLAEHDAPALRLFLVSAQYRNPINFSREMLQQAASNWKKLADTLAAIDGVTGHDPVPPGSLPPALKEALDGFEAAMDDDLNTPGALASIFTAAKLANENLNGDKDPAFLAHAKAALSRMLGVLGLDEKYLDRHDGKGGAGRATGVALESLVNGLVEQRAQARKAKDWATADAIRDTLNAAGIEINDGKDGTTWNVKSP